MQRARSMVSLWSLGWAWTLVVVLALQEPLFLPQENFDLGGFLGRWYEVAVVSTCPHFMERKSRNPVILALELQHGSSEGSFTMTSTSYRNGTCRKTSTNYASTNTPGRFFYHFSKFVADVDSFVVRTNYDEYAMMLQLSIEKPSGNETTIVKLYSRTENVTSAVLEDFKTLVRQHGISDGAIIMNQHTTGECVPDEQVTKPQKLVLQRPKRNMVNVVPAQEEDDVMI